MRAEFDVRGSREYQEIRRLVILEVQARLAASQVAPKVGVSSGLEWYERLAEFEVGDTKVLDGLEETSSDMHMPGLFDFETTKPEIAVFEEVGENLRMFDETVSFEEGYCYLHLVKAEYRETVRADLLAWPSLFRVLSLSRVFLVGADEVSTLACVFDQGKLHVVKRSPGQRSLVDFLVSENVQVPSWLTEGCETVICDSSKVFGVSHESLVGGRNSSGEALRVEGPVVGPQLLVFQDDRQLSVYQRSEGYKGEELITVAGLVDRQVTDKVDVFLVFTESVWSVEEVLTVKAMVGLEIRWKLLMARSAPEFSRVDRYDPVTLGVGVYRSDNLPKPCDVLPGCVIGVRSRMDYGLVAHWIDGNIGEFANEPVVEYVQDITRPRHVVFYKSDTGTWGFDGIVDLCMGNVLSVGFCGPAVSRLSFSEIAVGRGAIVVSDWKTLEVPVGLVVLTARARDVAHVKTMMKSQVLGKSVTFMTVEQAGHDLFDHVWLVRVGSRVSVEDAYDTHGFASVAVTRHRESFAYVRPYSCGDLVESWASGLFSLGEKFEAGLVNTPAYTEPGSTRRSFTNVELISYDEGTGALVMSATAGKKPWVYRGLLSRDAKFETFSRGVPQRIGLGELLGSFYDSFCVYLKEVEDKVVEIGVIYVRN